MLGRILWLSERQFTELGNQGSLSAKRRDNGHLGLGIQLKEEKPCCFPPTCIQILLFFFIVSSWTVSHFTFSEWLIFLEIYEAEQLSSSRVGCRDVNRSMLHRTPLQGGNSLHTEMSEPEITVSNACHSLLLSPVHSASWWKQGSQGLLLVPYLADLLPFPFITKYLTGDTIARKRLFAALSTHHQKEEFRISHLTDRWPELELFKGKKQSQKTTVWVTPPATNWAWSR